jgi:hypothetical protein
MVTMLNCTNIIVLICHVKGDGYFCVIEILILVAEMLILVKWHVLGNCLIKLLILSIELLMRAESQYNDNGGFIQCY